MLLSWQDVIEEWTSRKEQAAQAAPGDAEGGTATGEEAAESAPAAPGEADGSTAAGEEDADSGYDEDNPSEEQDAAVSAFRAWLRSKVPPSCALFSLGDGLVFVADPDNVQCQGLSAVRPTLPMEPFDADLEAVSRTARRIDHDVRTDKQAVVVAAGLVSSQHLRRFEHGAWMLTGTDEGTLRRVKLDESELTDRHDDVPKAKLQRTEFRNQCACFTDPRLFDVDFIVGPDAEVIRANRAVLAVNNAVLMRVLFGMQDGVDAKIKMVVWKLFAPEAVRIVFEAIATKTRDHQGRPAMRPTQHASPAVQLLSCTLGHDHQWCVACVRAYLTPICSFS